MKKISSILIANRGEPVRRAIRTFKKMGIRAVTIAVAEDLSSDWVAESDCCLTVPSYQNGADIVRCALQAKADAIWPAWGFLSENAAFAQSVVAAGLIWIGPPPEVISQMGSKDTATVLAKKAGLQTIPEVNISPKALAEESLEELTAACAKTGYPILLKPALGGGGQGQQVVSDQSGLLNAWQTVFQINKTLFHSGPILVQSFFAQARHIETQILADRHGTIVVLGERECSVQRRNQKVLEEAPSPALTDRQRADLIEASAHFAKKIGYESAGTIEFLYARNQFYFLEMNTRLQVEHPVTEETIRVRAPLISPVVDLVAEMIKVARGEKLLFTQPQIYRHGHAIEARLYAEDPEKNYQPAPGEISFFRFPQENGLRLESAFKNSPAHVSPNFDPMIAKVIAWGENRGQAIAALKKALTETVILGVPTNLKLCRQILDHERFQQGDYATNFLRKNPGLTATLNENTGLTVALAGCLRYLSDQKNLRNSLRSTQPTSLTHMLRHIPKNGMSYNVFVQGKKLSLRVEERMHQFFSVRSGNWEFCLRLLEKDKNQHTAILPNFAVVSVFAHEQGDHIQLSFAGITRFVKLVAEGVNEQTDPHASPIAGQIVKICVAEGESVEIAQELFQIESMKMITAIRAVRAGVVERILKTIADPVLPGEPVVHIPFNEEKTHDESFLDPQTLGDPCVSPVPPLSALVAYFQGYDIDADYFQDCLTELETNLLADNEAKVGFEKTVVHIVKSTLLIRTLFKKNEHIVTFLAEQETEACQHMPKEQEGLLKKIFADHGIKALAELAKYPRVLIHCFQAFFNDGKGKERNLIALLQMAQRVGFSNTALVDPLVTWLKTEPKMDEVAKNDIWALLYLLSPSRYYEVGNLPVALEFLPEYRLVKKNPAHGIDEKEYGALLAELEPSQTHTAKFTSLTFSDFPDHLKSHLTKWFAFFKGRELKLPQLFVDNDIRLFELVPPTGPDKPIPPRFIVLALVAEAKLEKTALGRAILPEFEQAAIYAYRALRLVQRGETHRPNNVFLLSKDLKEIPWRTRDGDAGKLVLTPEAVRQASARVSGFAHGIQIEATEVVLPVLNDADNKVYWTVLEIRHAGEKGVISRPPFLLEEREPKKPQDEESQMNERQHRMGKLLNRDRAMLLFDNGDFRELFFPLVDDTAGIGLNVYEGKVGGMPTLCYAGDFRFRGGALGEREGKKLASAVVLAYLLGRPLVGFHDGAGANIKESVASLGWAGTYFSAIAHTGGFSTREKFRSWYKNHIDRDYFDQVIRHFGLSSPLDEVIDKVERQLIHFHLHVGATVGMLVYGASIAHASLMNDQPECYRVLTGAGTVKRVLGEKGTNYSLGGAKAHAEKSGDIEMVFSSEELVIDRTRKLLKIFTATERKDGIERDKSKPVLDVPKKAGIILGRDAIVAHVDRGEFFEIRPTLKRANGILTGYVALGGKAATIVACATDYGIAHANGFKKALQLVESAQDLTLPVILACGAQWEAPSIPVPKDYLMGREELFHALKLTQVPKISIALGPRSLEQNIHHAVDITVYVARGDETEMEMERAHELCPFVLKGLALGFDRIERLLSYLPTLPSCPATLGSSDPAERRTQITLPKDLAQGYDMRSVIAEIFDERSFVEFWQADNLPLLCGLATLNERVVGVIADNPEIESGAQNIDSIQKFTRFNRLCERFTLPVIQLNDSPAFRPGHEQEHRGIQGVGGRSIREESLSRNPKIAVTLRQNYGGRFIHANLITLGAPRVGLSLKGAKIGVMGAKGAVGVLYAKKLVALSESEQTQALSRWQREYEEKQLNPNTAVKLKYLKKLIEPSELRRELCQVLSELSYS